MPDIDWKVGEVKGSSGRRLLHLEFMNCFSEFGFTQLITGATHERGNTLDLVFVNFNLDAPEPSIISPGLSDHYFVDLKSKVV